MNFNTGCKNFKWRQHDTKKNWRNELEKECWTASLNFGDKEAQNTNERWKEFHVALAMYFSASWKMNKFSPSILTSYIVYGICPCGTY